MKYLILITALLSTAAMADTKICKSEGFSTEFIIQGSELIDTNEKIVATEVSTGKFISNDQLGEVVYTIHGDNIIMQFDDITKVYYCQ